MSTKRCLKCGETKPLSEFHRNKSKADGLWIYCRPCDAERTRVYRDAHKQEISDRRKGLREGNRPKLLEWERKSLYGVSGEEQIALYQMQGGRCAICEVSLPTIGTDTQLDHNHATGVARGYLCRHCNRGLGGFQDDTARMLRAVDYLRTGGPLAALRAERRAA